MTTHRIENNVPMPAPLRKNPLTETLKTMKVGESFVTPERPIGGILMNRRPKKFATRAVEGGYRVWRTE